MFGLRKAGSIDPGSFAFAIFPVAARIRLNVIAVLVEEDLAVVLAHIHFKLACGTAALPAVITVTPASDERGTFGLRRRCGSATASIRAGISPRRHALRHLHIEIAKQQ